MAKSCVTEKTARRQEWIENGLLELMQTRKFEEITVTDLCRHLELSRRSFYRYFRDLEDVLDSVLVHAFQTMAIPQGSPEPEDIRQNFEFWKSRCTLLDALHRSGMLDKLYEYTARFTTTEDIRNYLPAEDRELWQEASRFAISGSMALIIGWYQEGFRKSSEEMARIAYRMLYCPILTRT